MLLEVVLAVCFCIAMLGMVWLATRYGEVRRTAAEAKASLDHLAQEKADEAADAPRFDSVFDRVRAKRRK